MTTTTTTSNTTAAERREKLKDEIDKYFDDTEVALGVEGFFAQNELYLGLKEILEEFGRELGTVDSKLAGLGL